MRLLHSSQWQKTQCHCEYNDESRFFVWDSSETASFFAVTKNTMSLRGTKQSLFFVWDPSLRSGWQESCLSFQACEESHFLVLDFSLRSKWQVVCHSECNEESFWFVIARYEAIPWLNSFRDCFILRSDEKKHNVIARHEAISTTT